MKKTRVYVDGYNLYYGLLKGTPLKWLDLVSFSRALLAPYHSIELVHYFTAPVKTYPYDAEAIDRQKIYLQALSAYEDVKTELGFYHKNKALLPMSDSRCVACEVVSENGLLSVIKLEEKRSDVNMAVAMVRDAAQTDVESFVVITGDSDLVGAIEALRYDFGRNVLVFNPHSAMSLHLKRAASYYKNIPRDLPAKCQLPEVVVVGANGRCVRRPACW